MTPEVRVFDFLPVNKVVKLLSIIEVVENLSKSRGEFLSRPFSAGIRNAAVARKALKLLTLFAIQGLALEALLQKVRSISRWGLQIGGALCAAAKGPDCGAFIKIRPRRKRDALLYDEHRNRGMRQHFCGLTSEQKPVQAAIAMRAHDDEIRTELLGGL